MINRRKQYASDERGALLGSSYLENNPQSNAGASIDIGPQKNDNTLSGYSADGPNLYSNLVQLPVQRKTRDKSPESTLPHINFLNRSSNPGSTSSSNLGQRQIRNETYELQPNGIHHSRAIDLSLGQSSFKPPSQTDFIYYTVQPGDTLQNLSVRYSCPVASIKRLNNLWSDQEFYGLIRLKLPVGKLRLIADVIDAEKTSKTFLSQVPTTGERLLPSVGASRQSTVAPSDVVEPQFQESELHNAVNPIRLEPEFELTRNTSDSIFKDYDLNIEKARTAALSYEDNASLIMQTLAQGGNIIDDNCDELAQSDSEILQYDISDYGLSYNGLLLFIFIVCLICPLAYVIYLEETHHESNKAS